MNLKQRIGFRVKLGRQRHKLTQAQLAEAIDKTFETISNIERGKTAPNFETLLDISQHMKIPMRDFFDEHEESDPEKSMCRLELEEKLRFLSTEVTDRELKMFVRICKAILNS